MLRSLPSRALTLSLLLAGACSSPSSSIVGAPASLAATPALVELPVGGGEALSVTATFPDGRVEDVTAKAAWSASDPSVARAAGNVVTGVAVGATTVTARFEGRSAVVAVTVVAARVKALAMDPATLELPVGADGLLVAKGTWTDGSVRSLGEGVDWSTSDEGIVSLDPDAPGRVVARVAGRAALTARFDGLAASALVTVLPSLLKSIAVAAPSSSLPLGLSQPLTATGTFADGSSRDITGSVEWSTSDDAVLSVSNESPTRGVVTARKAGTATVRARMNYLQGTTDIVVTDPVVSLAVAPASLSVPAGRTAAFTVVGTDAGGDTHDATASVSWTIVDASVARDVSDAAHPGLIQGLVPGTTRIVASLKNLSAEATLSVGSAVVDRLVVEPAEATFPKGRTLPLSAVLIWSDGSREDVTDRATWRSDLPDAVTTGPGGVAVGTTEGTATVTATLDGMSAGSVLTVGPAVLERIEVDSPVASLHAGVATRLTATGRFSDGADRPLSDIVWSVDDAAKGAITTDGRVTAASAGGTIIVRAAKDGLTGTRTLAVSTAGVSALRVVLVSTALPAGAATTATATLDFDDLTFADVSEQAFWTSSNETVATVAAGRVTAQSTGTTTIGASLLGQTGTALFTVTPPAVTGLEVISPKARLAADETVVLTVSAVRSDGTKTSPETTPTFQSSAPSVIAVDASGRASWVAPGKATLTASAGAFNATLELEALPREPSAVKLSAPASKVRAGETLTLTAIASFPVGGDVDATAEAVWTSSDTSKAIVSAGVVTGVSQGNVTLSATYLGVTGTYEVEVTKACTPVINEVQTYGAGGATDEFIELHNPCARAIDISATTVAYRSKDGTSDFRVATLPSQTTLAQGSFALLRSSSSSVPAASPLVVGTLSGLSSDGGLQWRARDGSVWDSLGWGLTTNMYVEKLAASKATDSTATPRSIARKADGIDTHDNASDFAVTKTPTPGAANVVTP
ncbi:MAG: hypothetical protein RL199_1111 [Pseudomonadota bacterium]|jgi:hypothetical protein